MLDFEPTYRYQEATVVHEYKNNVFKNSLGSLTRSSLRQWFSVAGMWFQVKTEQVSFQGYSVSTICNPINPKNYRDTPHRPKLESLEPQIIQGKLYTPQKRQSE